MPVRRHALFLFLLRPAFQATAILLVLGCVAAYFFEPRFHSNDDVMMRLTASGVGMVSAPDPHLFHTSALFIGHPLVWLYTHFPTVSWYAVYLVGAYAMGAATFGMAVARLGWSFPIALIWGLFVVSSWAPFFRNLQYTSAAFSLGLGATALLWSHLAKPGTERAKNRAFFVALVLLLAANAVRHEAFLAIEIFAVVSALGLALIRREDRKRNLMRLGILAVLSTSGAVAMNTLERAYYAHSPGWETAFEYNAERRLINDYDDAHPYSEVGWSDADYLLYRAFFAWDERVYSHSNLKKLNEATRARPTRRSFAEVRQRLAVNWTYPHAPLAVGVVAFCLLACLLSRASAVTYLWFAATTGLAGTMMLYLAYTGRLPFWVFHSLLLIATAPGIFASSLAHSRAQPSASSKGRFVVTLVLSIATLPLVFYSLRLLHRDVFWTNGVRPRLEQAIQKLVPLNARLFVIAGSGWPFPLIPAFSKAENFLPPAPMVLVGPLSQFPPTRRQFALAGGTDLYLDLVNREDFYLVVPTRKKDAQLVVEFLREHHGIDATAERVVVTDFSDVYRFHRAGVKKK